MEYKTIIVTAALTTAITIAGSFAYEEAKKVESINIVTTSFGFGEGNGQEKIVVDKDLIRLTTLSNYGNTIDEESSYEELNKERHKATNEIKALKQAIERVENWLELYSVDLSKGDNINNQLNHNILLKHPFFSVDSEFVAGVTLKIKRDNMGDPPFSLEDMEHLSNVLKVRHDALQKVWTLHSELVRVPIRYGELPPEFESLHRNLARTFSRGVSKNIDFYSEQFLNSARAHMQTAEKIKSKAEELLSSHSRLAVRTSIINDGTIPITIKPYVVAEIGLPEAPLEIVLESIALQDSDKEPNPFEAIISGVDDDIESFLPEITRASYVNVQPGEVITMDFISSEALGENGIILNKHFETGLLPIKIATLSTESEVYASEPYYFSRNIDANDKSLLIQYLRSSTNK